MYWNDVMGMDRTVVKHSLNMWCFLPYQKDESRVHNQHLWNQHKKSEQRKSIHSPCKKTKVSISVMQSLIPWLAPKSDLCPINHWLWLDCRLKISDLGLNLGFKAIFASRSLRVHVFAYIFLELTYWSQDLLHDPETSMITQARCAGTSCLAWVIKLQQVAPGCLQHSDHCQSAGRWGAEVPAITPTPPSFTKNWLRDLRLKKLDSRILART